MKKAMEEFVEGKHGIGYVNSDFKKYFSNTEFEVRPMPTFQKLTRTMKDSVIESELRPGFCELGDVLAFIEDAPKECKDGWANLFYFSAFVVGVGWDGGGWRVSTWKRGAFGWCADDRVFSPATGRSNPCQHCCHSCALDSRLLELEEFKKKVEKVLKLD